MRIISKSDKQVYEISLKRNSGEEVMVCPKCSDERKKKSLKCFSWNHEKQLGHCSHCDESFYTQKERVKEYVLPVPKLQKVSDKVLKWFEGRGISNNTLLRFKITESKEYFPQVSAERNCICFNYFRDEKLINIKFRDGEKNFIMAKDAELIFYNIDAIKQESECVICEGEIDCISLHEAGIFNSVSVPNGATKKHQNLDYLDNCIDYFIDLKKIILFTDNDEAGLNLRDELSRRLGSEKCWVVKTDCKDANEVLTKYGKEKLKEIITSAVQLPIEGISQVEESEDELMLMYKVGYPVGEKVGYERFDEHISFRPSELTIITAQPNAGKSTFLTNLLVRLSNRSKWRHAIFSPEKYPTEFFISEIAEILVGKKFFSFNSSHQMTRDELGVVKDFVNEFFWFMRIDEIDLSIDGILEKCRELVVRNGVNSLVIDPYNYIEHKIPQGQTETQYISELLTKIKRFKDKYKVHVFLVAHPTKLYKNKEGKYDIPTLYSISGSANFFNKTDNGIVLVRNFDENKTEVHIQKIRWSFVGKLGEVNFQYNVDNKRFTEYGDIESNEFDKYVSENYTKVPF